MTTPEKLNDLAATAAALLQEMTQQLSKFDSKTTALLLGDLPVTLPDQTGFPDDRSYGKLDAAVANKRLEEFLATIRQPEKYPLETRVAEADEMKRIIASYQQKISQLYENALTPVTD